MTCTAYYKHEGNWEEVCDLYVKHEDAWKEVCSGWIKNEGAWEPFYVTNSPTVEFVVVAGGGGGASNDVGYDPAGGGGGAGGFRASVGAALTSGRNSNPEPALKLQVGVAHTISIGGGGSPGNGDYVRGGNGGNSQLAGIVSLGGGGAGYNGNNIGRFISCPNGNECSRGRDGGSGGGCGYQTIPGCGEPGQGFDGFQSGGQGSGGGGAGEGSDHCEGGTSLGQQAGGDGLPTDITGTETYYAGGGGTANQPGGIGGGGQGGINTGGLPGTANTGGGGGGSGNIGAQGRPGDSYYGNGQQIAGSGGSGIVIFRVPNLYQATFTAGMTVNGQTSGSSFAPTPNTAVSGYNIYTVTGGTGSFTLSN